MACNLKGDMLPELDENITRKDFLAIYSNNVPRMPAASFYFHSMRSAFPIQFATT